jgi:peroxiredoxin
MFCAYVLTIFPKERTGGCQQELDAATIDLGVQTGPSAAIWSPPCGKVELVVN